MNVTATLPVDGTRAPTMPRPAWKLPLFTNTTDWPRRMLLLRKNVCSAVLFAATAAGVKVGVNSRWPIASMAAMSAWNSASDTPSSSAFAGILLLTGVTGIGTFLSARLKSSASIARLRTRRPGGNSIAPNNQLTVTVPDLAIAVLLPAPKKRNSYVPAVLGIVNAQEPETTAELAQLWLQLVYSQAR